MISICSILAIIRSRCPSSSSGYDVRNFVIISVEIRYSERYNRYHNDDMEKSVIIGTGVISMPMG
ncbi:hypothetical protein DERP_002252 [Dermatophagoides pteronyssinus]|uniref:Uncharacterized protein n=1 Tax=Dermatophagoides pteronyssinus TaxID=6956 RepID=A0ABQ8JHQ2_DERPT|nr:hypothetical protein DERP_002252 [Dermatophagoides pteronyssinus]